jgi:hypothetical protein
MVPSFFMQLEHVLHLVAQRHAAWGKARPVRARVGELEVGDEIRVLARGVDDGGVAAERRVGAAREHGLRRVGLGVVGLHVKPCLAPSALLSVS